MGKKKDERLRVIVLETEHRSENNRTQKRMATQTQDSPSNPNPNATSLTPSSSLFFRGAGASAAPVAGSGESHSHHRRALSEVSYRLPDDMMDLSPSDPFNGGSSTASLEEIGSEDDLFSTYIDVEKLGSSTNGAGRGNGSDQSGYGNGTNGHHDSEKSPRDEERPRHRHSSSVDGSSSTNMFGEIMEAKKAMPPDKLAELWNIDPKRAKRSFIIFLQFFSEFVFWEMFIVFLSSIRVSVVAVAVDISFLFK